MNYERSDLRKYDIKKRGKIKWMKWHCKNMNCAILKGGESSF